MTSEAAVTKLMWALGKNIPISEIKDLFSKNFVGEISFGDNI